MVPSIKKENVLGYIQKNQVVDFINIEVIVSYFLLAIYCAAPFVKINGNQFLMFNVLERKFNIFGFPFWPQDFHLFVISMIIGVVLLFSLRLSLVEFFVDGFVRKPFF